MSDASGQTGLAPDPGGGAFAPLTRSNSVLMERVRQEQYARLDAMEKGGLLKGLMFLHLKRDLDVTPVDWKGCEEPPEEARQSADAFTEYGIQKANSGAARRHPNRPRQLLGCRSVRPDDQRLSHGGDLSARGWKSCRSARALRIDWRFLAIDKVISEASTHGSSDTFASSKLLRSGGSRMFRVWTQSRALLLRDLAPRFRRDRA